jgi:hypothetical protein
MARLRSSSDMPAKTPRLSLQIAAAGAAAATALKAAARPELTSAIAAMPTTGLLRAAGYSAVALISHGLRGCRLDQYRGGNPESGSLRAALPFTKALSLAPYAIRATRSDGLDHDRHSQGYGTDQEAKRRIAARSA